MSDLFESSAYLKHRNKACLILLKGKLQSSKSKQLSIIEKTRCLLFKQKCFQKIIWNNTV